MDVKTELIWRVVADQKLGVMAKMVCLELMRTANGKFVRIGQRELAKRLKSSGETVGKALKELEAAEYVKAAGVGPGKRGGYRLEGIPVAAPKVVEKRRVVRSLPRHVDPATVEDGGFCFCNREVVERWVERQRAEACSSTLQ